MSNTKNAPAAQESRTTTIISHSSIGTESVATETPQQPISAESLTALIARLALEFENVEAGFQQIAPILDTLEPDIAAPLKEARIAFVLLQRELASPYPHIDVIQLCYLIVKRVAGKAEIFVDAFMKSSGQTAGAIITAKLIQRMFDIDFPAVVSQIEHWIQYYHNLPF